MFNKKYLFYLIIFIVVVIIAVIIYFNFKYLSPTNLKEASVKTTSIIPTNILSGKADNEPVANVNGVSITVGQLKKFAKKSLEAIDPSDLSGRIVNKLYKDSLRDLIDIVVLEQAIENSDIKVDDELIQNELKMLSDMENLDVETYLSQLSENGVDKKELIKDIENNLKMKLFFKEKILVYPVVVTEEDISKHYNTAQSELTNDRLPPLSLPEIRRAMMMEVRVKKERELINNYISKLKKASTINVFIDE